MSSRLDSLQQRIAPLRGQLVEHPLYHELDSLPALRRFMESHVFAVWDFMSLLKALQQRMCCVSVPWVPARNAAACRLINEIVLAEESDEDGAGGYASHFELYLNAMQRCGADCGPVQAWLAALGDRPLQRALDEVSHPARDFVRQTFAVIESGDVVSMAAAFAFGREDLLPDLFRRIVEQLNRASAGNLDRMLFYLDRHIALDGDEHGPLAFRLVSDLCGDDEAAWDRAESAAASTLEARLRLWDGILMGLRTDDAACSPGGASLGAR